MKTVLKEQLQTGSAIGGLGPPKIMRTVLKELLQTVRAIGGLVPPQNYRDSNIGGYPPERI